MRGRLLILVGLLLIILIPVTILLLSNQIHIENLLLAGIVSLGVLASTRFIATQLSGGRWRLIVLIMFIGMIVLFVLIWLSGNFNLSAINFAIPVPLLILIGGIIVGLGIVVSGIISVRGERNLVEERLGRYEQGYESFLDIDNEDEIPLKKEDRRALDAIDKAIAKRNSNQNWTQVLEQTNSKLALFEYLWLHCICFIAGYGLSLLVLFPAQIPQALGIGTIAFFLPRLYIGFLADRRLSLFRQQLNDTLLLWANALRSGFSPIQAVEAIARDTPEPSSSEFKRIVQEIQLGIEMQEAFQHATNRVDSDDFRLVAITVNIQREIGGNLAEMLSIVNAKVRWQIRLSNDIAIRVKPLYRIFFVILFGMMILQWWVAPDYLTRALSNPLGRNLMLTGYGLVSLALLAAGSANQRVRDLRQNVHGLWNTFRTFLIDAVLGGILIALAYLAGVPLVGIGWLALMLVSANLKYPLATLFVLLPIIGIFILLTPDWLPTVELQMRLLDHSVLRGFDILSTISLPQSLTFSLLLVSDMGIVAAIIIAILIFLVLMRIGIRDNRGRDALQERLAQFGERELPESLRELEMSLSFADRVLLPLFQRLAAMLANFHPLKRIQVVNEKIELSGLVGLVEPVTIFLMQILLMLGLMLVTYLAIFVYSDPQLPNLGLLLVCLAGVTGYAVPHLWLRQRVRLRKQNVMAALPDVMDLLVICVEAGLGLNAAMYKIFENWDTDLAIQFGRTSREIALGKVPREALRDLAARNRLLEIDNFVMAATQADQLGVSMAPILRTQSEQLRVRQQQRIEDVVQRQMRLSDFALYLMLAPGVLLWLIAPIAANLGG